MPLPALNLNLAPQPSLWRQQHLALGWAALALGTCTLATTLGFTWRAYHQAGRAGRDAVSLATEARRAAIQERELQKTLQAIDPQHEKARWALAERILMERSLPWSRVAADIESCMVPNMRLRSIQRVRGSSQQVIMKLKGEARTVDAEEAFIKSLSQDPVFAQVVLEREAQRQGGGWEFDLSLPVVAVPPPLAQDRPEQKPGPAGAGQATTGHPPAAAAPRTTPARSTLRTPSPAPRATQPILRPAPAAPRRVIERAAPRERRFRPARQRPSHGGEGGAP